MPTERVLTCHRTACDSPAHPLAWNRITGGLYCKRCALRIDAERPEGDDPYFPLLKHLDSLRCHTGKWGIKVVTIEPETSHVEGRTPAREWTP